jgi:hypothetical protein
MTDPITTATEALASARTRYNSAQQAHSAAKAARDNANSVRDGLIRDAAATGRDVNAEMQDHRQSLGGLQGDFDLTGAILVESKAQMDAAELALLQEQASVFAERWEAVIATCILRAKDADTARAAAQDAMSALDAAQQAVVAVAHEAMRHDVTVKDAVGKNERLAVMHRSDLPLVGKVMSAEFTHQSLRPRLALVTRHGPETFPFHHSMLQHFTGQLSGKLPPGKLMEILAQLADAPAGVA